MDITAGVHPLTTYVFCFLCYNPHSFRLFYLAITDMFYLGGEDRLYLEWSRESLSLEREHSAPP